MKNKFFLTAVYLLLFNIILFAQKPYIQAGYNLSTTTTTSGGNVDNTRNLSTFNVGIMNAFNLSPTFDLEAGLLFTGKGAKEDIYFTSSTSDNYSKRRLMPYYIELPLNVLFRIPIDVMGTGNTKNRRSGINIYAGPYGAMGVAGKVKGDTRILGINSSFSNDIEFNNDNPFTSQQEGASNGRLKRFDYGLNFGLKFEFEKALLKVNYGLGLSKINSTQQDNGTDDKNKYRVWSFSLGYMF